VVAEDSRDPGDAGGIRCSRGGPLHSRTPVQSAAPQAIELLHRLGGYQASRTFLVDRHLLIEKLRRLAEGEEFERESRRRERLDGSLDRLRRQQTAARVQIPVPPDVFSRKLADLSADIALESGHLHVVFSGAEELLGKLYELAQVASNDYDRFRAAVESVEPRGA